MAAVTPSTILSLTRVQQALQTQVLPFTKLPVPLRQALAPIIESAPANRFALMVPANTVTSVEFTNVFLSSHPGLVFIVSPGAHLTLIEHIKYSQPQTGRQTTAIFCQKGAQADYFTDTLHNQSHDADITALIDTHGRVSLNWYGRLRQTHNVNITLRHIGWHTTGDMNVIVDASDTAAITMSLLNDHQQQNSRGAIRWAGLGRDQSHIKVDGRIKIGPKGRGTDSVLFQNALLLSQRSRVNNIPNLEILNYDVKAYHGATVGQLSELEKFYLTARGLSAQQADAMLIDAWLHRVSQHAPSVFIKQQFDRLMPI